MKIKMPCVPNMLMQATGLCHTIRVTIEMNLKVAAGIFLDLAAG